MTLLQSWADSLTLLKPKNLQLFVMVTIKSILEAYKLYFKYFWWLLLAMPLFPFISINAVGSLITETNMYGIVYILFFIFLLFFVLLFSATCLIARPSMFQKDCSYFRIQFKKTFLYCLLLLPLCLLYVPWYIFFVLFLADSEGGIKNCFLSIWYAFKMLIYNLPLVVIITFCLHIPVALFEYMFFVSPVVKIIIGTFVLPVTVCTHTNIYIKKLHDQFDLYIKQPE